MENAISRLGAKSIIGPELESELRQAHDLALNTTVAVSKAWLQAKITICQHLKSTFPVDQERYLARPQAVSAACSPLP